MAKRKSGGGHPMIVQRASHERRQRAFRENEKDYFNERDHRRENVGNNGTRIYPDIEDENDGDRH